MPDINDLLNNAINNHKNKNYKKAKDLYEKAIKILPSNIDLKIYYGTLLHDIGLYENSIKIFTNLINQKIKLPIIFYNRANIYMKLKSYDDALSDIEICLSLNSKNDQALNIKGLILARLKKHEESLKYFNEAIEYNNKKPHYYLNKGNALGRLSKFNDAICEFNKSIKISSNYYKAYYSRALAKEELGLFDESIKDYEKSYFINNEYFQALTAKSRLLIRLGKFQDGWKLYENRLKENNFILNNNKQNKPVWLGKENLDYKTILLHHEQGLGDTLQFCRYVKLFDTSKTNVVLIVQKQLLNIIKSLDDKIIVKSDTNNLPSYDYFCPLMSLPLAFNSIKETIPVNIPYISTSQDKIKYWKNILGPHKEDKIRVGFAWSGNPNQINDHKRSFTLSEVKDDMSDDIEWINLHNSIRTIDANIISETKIKSIQSKVNDFSDTAAICELVDVVLSVDTSIAHLAASLGKTVYLMLPFYPDFRWMQDDTTTPWYPNIKIIKHKKKSNWSELITIAQNHIINNYKK